MFKITSVYKSKMNPFEPKQAGMSVIQIGKLRDTLTRDFTDTVRGKGGRDILLR